MITAWVIGLILSFLGIYLFKNSRLPAKRDYYSQVVHKPERPVLKVWNLFLFILGALVPIFNIIMGVMMIIWWAICVYGDKDWLYDEDLLAGKFVQFLNKPIK